MGLASIVVLGVVGFVAFVLVAGIIAGEWELWQRNRNKRG
ncbi:hypothetical protein ES703_19809 [subsurface metagenome]